MYNITATMQTETAELRDDTLKQMVKYMDKQHIEFSKGALTVHRKTVFEILILLIRYTPVDTGRLRGSWTPYLDRHNKQGAYQRYLKDSSLSKSHAKNKGVISRLRSAAARGLGMDPVSQGKALGFFFDGALVTTIGSNVEYAYDINAQNRYFDDAAIDANRIVNANFEQYLAAARKAGWIPTDYKDDPKPEA